MVESRNFKDPFLNKIYVEYNKIFKEMVRQEYFDFFFFNFHLLGSFFKSLNSPFFFFSFNNFAIFEAEDFIDCFFIQEESSGYRYMLQYVIFEAFGIFLWA